MGIFILTWGTVLVIAPTIIAPESIKFGLVLLNVFTPVTPLWDKLFKLLPPLPAASTTIIPLAVANCIALKSAKLLSTGIGPVVPAGPGLCTSNNKTSPGFITGIEATIAAATFNELAVPSEAIT